MDNCFQRCNDCEDWAKACFTCRFSQLQEDHQVRIEVDSLEMTHITGFEFLSKNPVPYRLPQLDFTFREGTRAPTAPVNNEPLARAIMYFADCRVLNVNEALALDIYMEALDSHSGLNDLNARVCSLLMCLRKDTEAISFIESLIQWPTMRFNKDIWLRCHDSVLDEIHGIENLTLCPLVVLGILKSRIVAELHHDQEKLEIFLNTHGGSDLEEIRSVLAGFLGFEELENQQRQLRSIFISIDERDDGMREALSGRQILSGEENRQMEVVLVGQSGISGQPTILPMLQDYIRISPGMEKIPHYYKQVL